MVVCFRPAAEWCPHLQVCTLPLTHQSWDRLQPHCHPELDNQKKMDGLLFLFAFCFLATWSFLWMATCVCVCGGGDCTSLMNSTGQSPFFQKIVYKDQYNPHHPIRVDYRVKPITHNNLMLICSELFHLRWSVSKFGRKLSNCNLMLMMFFFLFFLLS